MGLKKMHKNSLSDFVDILEEAAHLFAAMGFREMAVKMKEPYSVVEFKRDDTIITYLYGPGDWEISFLIDTLGKRYEFKDLLDLPKIRQWVANNRYVQTEGKNIKDEIYYSIALLKFSLQIIDSNDFA